MAAMTEFAARHSGARPEDAFAADEVACELHLTPLSAAEQIWRTPSGRSYVTTPTDYSV
jgi:hypothetical protein